MSATSVVAPTTTPNTKRPRRITLCRRDDTGAIPKAGVTASDSMVTVDVPTAKIANMNTAAGDVDPLTTLPKRTEDSLLTPTPLSDITTTPVSTPPSSNTALSPPNPPPPTSRCLAADPSLSIDFPITTRLIPEQWSLALPEAGIFDKYAHIPIGLKEGFFIGVENYSLAKSFNPPNHHIGEVELNVARAKFTDEIALGRISPGFPPEVLQSKLGNFRTAPIAVIQQNQGSSALSLTTPSQDVISLHA